MNKDTINPESLFTSVKMGYSQAVKSSRPATIYCSGQVAWDAQCQLVGGNDIGRQAHQVLANLKQVLESAGAEVADIVQLRTYVVDLNPTLLGSIFGTAIAEFYGDVTPAANTMIGVQSLALPEFLIEIEATACVG